MIGKHSQQGKIFGADQGYLKFVGEHSFYGYLASQRGKLFHDEDFAEFYCPDNGRPSVAPSLLANALLLQTYDHASDEEAKERADYDLRWKVALGIEIGERPFAKSTLQMFRAQLILKEKMQAMFIRSLDLARETGYLKDESLKVVLDTTNILGRGAVKDTYNLLGDGIKQLCKVLAGKKKHRLNGWVREHGFERYFRASLKGDAQVDWDKPEARQIFLQGIVEDAQRLLEIARDKQATLLTESTESQSISAAGELLKQLIVQDVKITNGKVELKEGVSRDRVISVHDPEMRHGHKSRANLFDGHKAVIGVDPDSQLIVAVGVEPGNAADATPAMGMTEESEANTGQKVEETIGDCAFGSGATRQEFEDADRRLVAKVPEYGRKDQIHKSQFHIDLDNMTCACPAGHITTTLVRSGTWLDKAGQKQPGYSFAFQAEVCANCPLRSKCIQSKARIGRHVHLHPQEKLLQKARAFQHSPAFQVYCKMRQTAEHRLARLVQLGIRQARYFGTHKSLFQLLMATTVANLTLITT